MWWGKDEPRRELPGKSLFKSWGHVTGGRDNLLLATLDFSGNSLPEQGSKFHLIAKAYVK